MAQRLSLDREVLRGLALATLSGVFWFVATPDFDLWPLAWIAAVPLLFVVDRASSTRRAVLFGAWCGLIANLGGFYWMGGLFHRFGHIPWPVAGLLLILFSAYQGLVFLFAAWSFRVIRRNRPLPASLVAPLTVVTAELLLPVLFPFGVFITQAWQPYVIQIADLGGTLAVTALLLMVNGAIYDLLTDPRRRLVSATIAATIVLLTLGYGHYRIQQAVQERARAPKIRVGIVQPNVALGQKGANSSRQLADLQQQSAALQAAGAELIVWPETAYPYPIDRSQYRDFSSRDARRIRRGFSAPLLFGAVTFDWTERPAYPRNTALMLAGDGFFRGSFDKIRLLVFGEYIPGLAILPSLRRFLPDTVMEFRPGDRIVTLPYRGPDGREWSLGPMICYEAITPAFGRKLASLRPHLLVNLTNDAWFGDTSEPWQHLALSVYRAVELRRDLVRAVNTGVSAYIDSSGRVYAKTYSVDPSIDPRPADAILSVVALGTGEQTIYARVGNLFAWACALVTVVLLVMAWPRFRGAESDPNRSP